jgi:hypothetical protein
MRIITVWTFLLIIFSGCAHHHPLLSKEQYSLIQKEGKYLADNRERIYSKIQQSTKNGALVIMPKDFNEIPHIFPGQSPIDAINSDQSTFEKLKDAFTNNCYFVFSPIWAVEPLHAPCQYFTEEAIIITELKSGNESNVALITSIDERIKKENMEFASALAPTMTLVKFHITQADILEKQMKIVSGALATNSESQQKANALLKDTIETFAKTYSGLKTSLDEILKKLDAIK